VSEQNPEDARVRPLRFEDSQIDCPKCGTVMTARLVIRETSSGLAIVACLGCQTLYPAEIAVRRSKPEA
jgi:hypothetical protein